MEAFPPRLDRTTSKADDSAQDMDDATLKQQDEDKKMERLDHHCHQEEEEEEIRVETMTIPAHLPPQEHAHTLPENDHQDTIDTSDQQQELFQVGDHVYQWCSLLGIPGVFQHHGIVIHVENTTNMMEDYGDGVDDGDVEQCLTIADFSNLLPESGRNNNRNSVNRSDEEDEIEFQTTPRIDQEQQQLQPTTSQSTSRTTGSLTQNNLAGSFLQSGSNSVAGTTTSDMFEQGCLRVYTTHVSSAKTQKNKWYKVQYGANWFKAHVWKRSGTCTPVESDPPETVLQRVNFLLSQKTKADQLLPQYHAIYANCECVAVWCKTGTWSTLQAASFLSHTAMGQVKGTATIASIAAAQQVTVPAAGVWGWLGYTTTVPLMSVQPWILPAVAAYGAVSIGGPAVYLAVAKRKWRKTSDVLNEAWQAYSLEVNLIA